MTHEDQQKKAEAAANSLRAATRSAHEAIRDLRAATREAKKVVVELEKGAQIAVEERLDPIVKEEVDKIGVATRQAMAEAVDKVAREFDRLEAIFMGTDKKSQRTGRPSIEEMLIRKKESES